ncbi:hypothetical protein MMC31_002853 [Peltigera leucophlebia]|nr:hypothetical protein [Peltigera leucophlebia]
MSHFPSPQPPAVPKSYLYPTTLPPLSPSILSGSSHHGNSPSYTRLRQISAGPQEVIIPTSYSSPSLSTRANDRLQTRPSYQFRRQRTSNTKSSRLKRNLDEEGHNWLLRTASALTTSTLEEKGQAWLVTRNSSTSLTEPSHSQGFGLANDEHSPAASRSRLNSRLTSRPSSRRGSVGVERGAILIEPDFVTPEREILSSELLPEVDEGEMKRIVMGRVGGWVDWAVGWIDFKSFGENESDVEPVEIEEGVEVKNHGERDEGKPEWNHDKPPAPEELRREGEKNQDISDAFRDDISNPLSSGEGGWSDAKWLLGVAGSIIL